MIRSPLLSHRRVISSGVGNFTGVITNLVEEKPLEGGVWAFSADRDFAVQINREPGQGMGAHPQLWFGFLNSTASSAVVIYDADWFVFNVPIGETRWLLFRKSFPFGGDGVYLINSIAGP